MLFQRIHFAIPREVRSNTERATAFTDNGMNMDTETLLSIIHRHQFPPEHRCSRDKLLVFCVSLPRMCSLPLPRMCPLTHTHTHTHTHRHTLTQTHTGVPVRQRGVIGARIHVGSPQRRTQCGTGHRCVSRSLLPL
jgi:hypothetical protein